ncbi:hypothetical protein DCO17_05300 [Polynucleobacter tropicus]|uniref:ABC transporter permease n=1 Tax=Polynucleobacter tropicus TaxID=1743174 RepID=A0A6M9Q6U8_9BURK|nr:hypothetical protein [Polynucleobacter tropicus]QKM64703.1 hypothetical protein DCO17_05300 [Polynucleobacter tropicus]
MSLLKGNLASIEAVISLILGASLIALATHFFARKDIFGYLFHESATIGYLLIAELALSVLAALLLVYRHVSYLEGGALVDQPPY